mmetsp:Transcript_1521/g.3973  ORF Transcript_1521/g.3973 Transcript_1521/m.3973 type:complete len:82 (-) Transcript_1521:88-333(-)
MGWHGIRCDAMRCGGGDNDNAMQCNAASVLQLSHREQQSGTSRHVTGRLIIEPNRTEPSHKTPDTRSDPSVPDSRCKTWSV